MESVISLTLDVAKCTNCRACELACSYAKEGVFSPELSRIQVLPVLSYGVNVPIFCVHCEPAPCRLACPFDAIYRDENSAIRIDAQLCTNCDLCPDACPIGAIQIPHDQEVAIACDLCDGAPVCVEHCIYGALRFESRPDAVFHDFTTPPEGERIGEKRWRIATTIAQEVRENSEVIQ